MWTYLIFLNLLALHCKASTSPPEPVNVIFSSVNLRNVLQWLPGNGTPEDTHFTVQYAIYGDSVEGSKGRRANWRAVRRCTEIVRNWCDLSNETWDLEHGYYGRVRAVSRRTPSKWAWTRRRFDPKTDTSFGPPLVSVEVEDNNAIITLKGPMRYQPNNQTPAVSMAMLYPMMTYNLSITNTRRSQMHHFPVASSSYKYGMMEYDTEYCFSARSRFYSMPAVCQSSAWQCITTPKDPVIGQLQRVVVGIVVPALCISMLVVIGYLLYHYLTGKGQKSPYILHQPAFYPPPPIFPSENPKLFPITIITEPLPERGWPNPACSKRLQQVAHPSSGYASQRLEPPPVPEDDLSVDYGFISMAPQIDIRGENWNNQDVEHQKSNKYEKKTWRVEDDSTGGLLTERSTLIQALPWPQPVLWTQTQAPLPSVQGDPIGEMDGEEKDIEFTSLFINTTPQTGLFNIPLNIQTAMEREMGEEMDRTIRVRADEEIDRGVKGRSKNEEVPLLSAYASQNTTDMSTSYIDQSHNLPDDYGVLRLDTACRTQADEEEDEGEEEGNICIDWDPQTRRLVLPEIAMEYNQARGLGGLMQGEKGRENRMGGEEEEVNLTKGELRLENVFVRQGSEERAEAQREMERGEGKECGVNDFLTRWNLVVSMDE